MAAIKLGLDKPENIINKKDSQDKMAALEKSEDEPEQLKNIRQKIQYLPKTLKKAIEAEMIKVSNFRNEFDVTASAESKRLKRGKGGNTIE